jgi:5-methylthioribose kinase
MHAQHLSRALALQMYHFDGVLGALAMRYIEPPHMILRTALMLGHRYSTMAADIATFLSRTLFFTSGLHLPAQSLRANVAVWSANRDMCALTEGVSAGIA